MLNIVEKTITKYNLLENNDTILVAVSGGADSLALLHCLYRLKEKYNLTLIVAHLNHMFRGKEAERDAEYVKKAASSLGIEAIIDKINVPEILVNNRISPQEGARNIRYDFLLSTAKKYGCSKIALGHHKDDQAETVLLNLLKGAGMDGLKGISPKREIYIRPLIEVKKRELEQYCEENKLLPCIDASNFKDIYLRNKIRNNLLPILEKDYNPRIVDSLANTAEILREENSYLDNIIEKIEVDNRLSLNEETKKGEWHTKTIRELPIALQRRFIRQVYTRATGNNHNLSFHHVENVRNLIMDKCSGNTTELPGDIKAICCYDRLKITCKEEYYSRESIEYYYEISIPGVVEIDEINAFLEVRCLSPSETMERLELRDDNEALISIEPEDRLLIRNRRPGDRFNPLGMIGTKKVKDLFIDEKINKDERDRIPIILSKKTGKIIWVAGVRLSEDFRNVFNKNSVLLRLIYKGKVENL